MSILDEIKQYLEVDDTDAYDNQLLIIANQGLMYLEANKIPVSLIDGATETFPGMEDKNFYVLKSWLCLYCLRMFDRTLMTSNTATQNWIDKELLKLEYQLKVFFDVGGSL